MKCMLIAVQAIFWATTLQAGAAQAVDKYAHRAEVCDVYYKLGQMQSFFRDRLAERRRELRDLHYDIKLLREATGAGSVNRSAENARRVPIIMQEITGLEHALRLFNRSYY